MNAIAWNCQGAGAYLTKHHLRKLHRFFHPRFLFLSETKKNFNFLQDFKFEFGYDNLFTVEPVGLSGGLALFYMNDADVEIEFSNARMIDTTAKIEGHKVFITFVYGDPVVEYREQVWERLMRISLQRSGAWLMVGDFNEITSNLEKKGGRKRPESSFLPFKNMISACGMIEFPHSGNIFSWAGRRRSGRVQCRLDRALGNEDWHQVFSHTDVEYLLRWGSDHLHVLVRIKSKESSGRKCFKFDKRWFGKEGFYDTVKQGWGQEAPSVPLCLHEKIGRCRRAISRWKKRNPSNNQKLIEKLKLEIDRAQSDDSISSEEELELKWKLCEAYREEELFWKQKSRTIWLREGDRNTKFFHAKIKQRRARNRITKLMDSLGNWVESEEGIEALASEYFANLFATSNPSDCEEAFRFTTAKVTQEMNMRLIREPSEVEIKEAVFAIHPEKAQGPDGMTSLFYQRFWKLIGPDIVRMVKNFFSSGELDEQLNQTNICLIQKTERPKSMKEFRPISLCNVSYKIISKVLSARLKQVLPKLISETQSAFVARRLISDNILIVQEMFHALRTNPSCQSKFVAVKTDMSKAYDRVEWSFLETMMLKMGFDERWIHLIMRCVSTVSYQVLINGEAKGKIVPSRRLRQGDPLSPFLFVLCTDVLISQLKQSEREKNLSGLKITRSSPPVSHLLFADDSLFFCKATQEECSELMRIIDVYSNASRQQLNKSKSSVLFGSKVVASSKHDLKRSLNINQEGGMGMYLGLPETICGSKKQVFSFVQERLNDRTNSWSSKLLSKGGKEIQIKAVAQAVPSHVMSCYLLPQGITKKLTGAVSHFWWSTKINNKGLHWVAWDKICVPTEEGGLGFRDFHDFNLTLLAKQMWRLLKYPQSLLDRVMKGIYYRHTTPMNVERANNPSYGWRSIVASKQVLKQGLRKRIGDGHDTKVWEEPWLQTSPARPPNCVGTWWDAELRVHHLIDPERHEWKQELLKEMVAAEDIPYISSIRVSRTGRRDCYSWEFTKSGLYTVKSGYSIAHDIRVADQRALVSEPSTIGLKKEIWKIKAPRKLKHFLWQATAGFLATAHQLKERHCARESTCMRCGAETESINHTLFECPPALQVWALSLIPTSPGRFPCTSLYANIDYLLLRTKEQGTSAAMMASVPWILWYLWKARNEKIFNNKDITSLDTIQLAVKEAESWTLAQRVPDTEVIMQEEPQTTAPIPPTTTPLQWSCQSDASWISSNDRTGLGFLLLNAGSPSLFGAGNTNRDIPSPRIS